MSISRRTFLESAAAGAIAAHAALAIEVDKKTISRANWVCVNFQRVSMQHNFNCISGNFELSVMICRTNIFSNKINHIKFTIVIYFGGA